MYKKKFSNVAILYDVDRLKNELFDTGEREDLQAKIQSNSSCALRCVLERFGVFPDVSKFEFDSSNDSSLSDVDDAPIVSDRLSELQDIHNRAEAFRDIYHLSANASLSDIYAKMNEVSNALKARLNKEVSANEAKKSVQTQKSVQTKEILNKEVSLNEAKNEQESK